MTNPPATKTTSSTSRALVPRRTIVKMTLLEDREETRILLLALRRERPLGLHRLVEFRSEEIGLHAAVDDVPGQQRVARSVAEHEEVGIHSGLRDSGTPVPAIAFRGLDGWRHPSIAERQQRLVERVPLRLDVEVDVVDAGHQAAHPLN